MGKTKTEKRKVEIKKSMKYYYMSLLCKSILGKRLAEREERGKSQRKKIENARRNGEAIAKMEVRKPEIQERKGDVNKMYVENGNQNKERKWRRERKVQIRFLGFILIYEEI